jgi:hypothetical protein
VKVQYQMSLDLALGYLMPYYRPAYYYMYRGLLLVQLLLFYLLAGVVVRTCGREAPLRQPYVNEI